jgi:NADPH:quinone reductase-like Zn-dependent oxidoreductase
MKLRTKILGGAAALVTVGLAALLVALSHESPCPGAPTLAAGVESMQAITHRCYGAPGTTLALERVAKPSAGDGEVLIRIHAASVNPYEWHTVTGKPYFMRLGSGLGAPKGFRVGYDMAGTIAAVGAGVTRFKVGDEVFGGAHGSLAEYATANEDGDVVLKPAGVPFEAAAGILIAGGTALQAVRDHGHVQAGQKVLINGASGGVGTYAVQLAKSFGAQVTAVCSTRNVELVRSLGADHVIDYTREDFTQGNVKYDLILDNVGNQGYSKLANVTRSDGYIVSVGGQKTNPWLGPISRVIVSRPIAGLFIDQHLPFYIARITQDEMQVLADFARDGKLRTVIDRRYPLEETSAALEYLGGGHVRGKVIVTIN